ncbi:MAG: M23 family metallopeptidase [Alphaproteobacteria bacterium]|nr:M23 family metallopeptidase [Alphaproteobacteria bacterium]
MFWLKEIRDRFLGDDTLKRLKLKLLSLMKVSESPAGFGIMAAIGLGAILLFHAIPSSSGLTVPPQKHSIIEQADIAADSGMEEAQPAETESDLADLTPTIDETYSLRRNETLIGLLKRANIPTAEAHEAVNALGKVVNLRRLQRGQEIRLSRSAGNGRHLEALRLRDSFDEEALLAADEGGFVATRVPVPTLSLSHLVEGQITDSLYLSAQRAGLPTAVIVDLIRLMSFDVDFEREIRVGDRFQVYFERRYAPDFHDLEEGRILHVKLELQKRTLEASYYEDEHGQQDYFDPDGNSTRRTLMKTPLDVTVVTSSYGRRKHPVLGYTRQHTGVDFRARTGTPIMAAGDGVVERASRYGGYGNYIRIRHNSTYKTAYAHLSKYGKGIKAGARVKQGQIIGYAGATGRVTAAHLHYEVLVNGKQANPMTLKLPTGRTLKGETLVAFKSRQRNLTADIAQIQMQQQYLQSAGMNAAHSSQSR